MSNRLLEINDQKKRALVLSELRVEKAMREACEEIASWRGCFVPLGEVGITGETADRIRSTF